MSRHEKYTRLKRQIALCLITGVALFSAVPMTYAATSVIPNNTLPSGGQFAHGTGNITKPNDLQMNIVQDDHNAVITWKDFSVGGSATVNFSGPNANYNTLNYVNNGKLSEIYGTINANNNGNIYIVNPAGVQIGNSAQINVGSLYVSTNRLDENALKNFYNNAGNSGFQVGGTGNKAAELMSLGNVNATKVTFEGGGRIVIDTERLKDVSGHEKLSADKIIVNAGDTNKLIVGYDAYDETNRSYAGKNNSDAIATVNNTKFTKQDGYMWVKDVDQLQAINTNLGGNYALRNSIDATGTAAWNNGSGFNSIGTNENGKVIGNGFTGSFDGLSYNIFSLTINKQNATNVGLFGMATKAAINNVTLVGGSITGGEHVGAIVGAALNGTTITNSTNSASVTGNEEVGGIAGSVDNSSLSNVINTGTITGNGQNQNGHGNVGGLVGLLENSSAINGTSYNLGNVSSVSNNVGGLVGHAINSTIGDGTTLVYNRLDVTGAYNVGGIVGNMEQGSKVLKAENSGSVSATGHTNGTYIYHTDATNIGAQNGIKEESVYIANVGGIAGNSVESSFTDVLNTGDISSNKQNNQYYDAGNVGGIVGSAVNTKITNATNRENNVRGAHNVGGVAGYFANSDDAGDNKYTVTNGVNDGGDIMATGARNGNGYVTETIRKNNGETFTIGNMGGIVGYLDGDNVYITASANRGTVHTYEPDDPTKVPEYAKAANAGGIVGKIDRNKNYENSGNADDYMGSIRNDYTFAAVSNSYNTGNVMGYTGIGGIAGMMYNGEIAGAYNLGTIRTTRQSDTNTTAIDPINMGGVVGDTTEQSSARAYLYDVYNKGKIGDETYTYFGRHVGGIVGRLSGTVEKAYNTGAIYNGYNVVGGIAGWMVAGRIENAFNTGNITVNDKNNNAPSEVGGIVGAADISVGDIYVENVYNLGTIRSFKIGTGDNVLGGIVGGLHKFYFTDKDQNKYLAYITNAYTTGNLYAKDGAVHSIWVAGSDDYGAKAGDNRYVTTNTYYIKPADNLKDDFSELKRQNGYNYKENSDNSNKAIEFDKKDNIVDGKYENQYTYTDSEGTHSLFDTSLGEIQEDSDWRIYEGSTPILNAFLPNAKDYFDGVEKSESGLGGAGIGSIQYGTAYDPLLTIIKADGSKDDLNFNWQDLGINNDAGIAVYGAGLTLDDFKATGGSGYFGGLIYSDGALNINANTTGATHNSTYETGDVSLGSSSQLYGSSVSINADGNVVIYGTVTATGNSKNGVTEEDGKISVENPGDITINAGNVDVYGKLTSAAAGEAFSIPGINSMAEGWTPGDVGDQYEAMSDIGDRFAYTTGVSGQNGDISITANGTEKDDAGNTIDGNVNLFFGNQEQGLITAGGSLKVEAQGDVFVDSDLDIGGNMKLTSKGANGEVLLTLTNIGKVQADRVTEAVESAINGQQITSDNKDNLVTAVGKVEGIDGDKAQKIADALINSVQNGKTTIQAVDELNEIIAVEYMHDFMHSFNKDTNNQIDLNVTESGSAKLTVDMWENGTYNFEKYDNDNHTFQQDLNNLKFYINDTDKEAKDFVYVEVNNGEQLKGIQAADKKALGYNYALMGDINASGIENYDAIGGEEGFSGTFDGRGNRIIGLDATKTSDGSDQTLTNAGIFSQIGAGGTVKNVNIYSGNFSGTSAAGAVAGTNSGTIENVTTFGNTVTVNSSVNVGGIVGSNTNTGKVDDVEAIGSVIAGGGNAGGLVGFNEGEINNSYSNSAVTGTANGLGGVVGVNNGEVSYVDSLGVTNGANSSQIGGIIGVNNGTMNSGYNESIVSGKDKVGGIIGVNKEGKEVTNVVNATSVTGNETNGEYVGGLIGSNSGRVTNGRNNGEITGHTYVGGLVGSNEVGSILTNLVNDSSASITGEQYVGGIAGSNAGEINANIDGLTNNGVISGVEYVGGIAGRNTGMIQNTHNNVTLNVNVDALEPGKTAQYFGGVAGINEESGIIGDATNTADVNANGAEFVGGIVGYNKGTLENMAGNTGNVVGENYVGGVAGKNDQNLDGVDASNIGIVHATNGGAGGIFAENSGNITNSILTNNAIVAGTGTTGATGGIIGVNSGDITYSSLKNEVNGQVIGMNNVGGLIGQNSGNITGGRDAGDGYYKYQIYNNGVIQVGTWNDTNDNHIVDSGEVTLGGQGSNIGGLFGTNTGKVTAAYNTGAIKAGDSSNVGGIAGQNSGTIDQVFSTIFDNNGNAGKVVGSTNVGGLVGLNTGVLSNAYNTSRVDGVSAVGNLVGQNNSTVMNVYATVAGLLIGNGSLAQNGYVAEDTQEWKNHGSYDGFDFDNDGGRIWKNYDGYGTPLLKVFLTKAFYDPATGQLVSAADGFNAHYNAAGGLIFPGMGTESNYLWSEQIGFGNGNPNWLGYDLVAMPDIPAWEFPGGRWDYLYSDAPFDRNKDFRERKAEINFVDGGMEL